MSASRSSGRGAARVVVVGSLNMDLVFRTDRSPVAGETLIGNWFGRVPGGKGANQAVAAARLGAAVSMVGRVGDDSLGDELLQSLAGSGVEARHVQRDPAAATGVAAIVVEEETGQNRIIVVSGANMCLTEADVTAAGEAIATAGSVIAPLEVPLPAIQRMAELGRRHGACVIVNPAPARFLPDDLLRLIDVITPNETEVEQLTGVAAADLAGASRAAAALAGRGVRRVVITLGARGAFVRDGEDEFCLPAQPVRAVDTVAAGDAFTGALAVALAEGKDLRAAAEFAGAAAAISVTRHGAQPSMPCRDEVEAFLREAAGSGTESRDFPNDLLRRDA